jgi:uncharacterized membrane protein
MLVRLRSLAEYVLESFWPIPTLLTAYGIVGALCLIELDKLDLVPHAVIERWLYNGDADGARTLLGAIASSTITVAGTAFSITIAALSLTAGQMGPRLLRNFTRDRGNQFTLGVLLATFSYALMVLRSIRTEHHGGFIPHLTLSLGIVLAIFCVGMLVYFIGHIASRINVDTVIELVSDDLDAAIERLTVDAASEEAPQPDFWRSASEVTDARRGYLQQLDEDGLASWAAEHSVAIRMLVGPGDYVFPGAPVALLTRPVEGAEQAIRNASALGAERTSSTDLRFAVRQLVEVAARALSPGINDPHTAVGVIDRLGAALCAIEPCHLPSGVTFKKGCVALVVPHIRYEQLLATMFHMIRQSAAGQPSVYIRLVEVLARVASCERDPARRAALRHHADLVLGDAERTIGSPNDVADVHGRHQALVDVMQLGTKHYLAKH